MGFPYIFTSETFVNCSIAIGLKINNSDQKGSSVEMAAPHN